MSEFVIPQKQFALSLKVNIIYLEGNFRNHWWMSREVRQGRKAANTVCFIQPVTSLDSWSPIPLGDSGTQSRTHASVLPSLRGKGAGVFIHQLPLFTEYCSFPGHPGLLCIQAEKAVLAEKASSHGHWWYWDHPTHLHRGYLVKCKPCLAPPPTT